MGQFQIPHTIKKLSDILKRASDKAKERCSYNGYLISDQTFQNEFRNLCIPFVRDLLSYLDTDGLLNYPFQASQKKHKITFQSNTIVIDAGFRYPTQNTAPVPLMNSTEMVLMCSFVIDGRGRVQFDISDVPVKNDGISSDANLLPEGALKKQGTEIDRASQAKSINTTENRSSSGPGAIAVNAIATPTINFVGQTYEELHNASFIRNRNSLLPHSFDINTGKTTWGNPKYMKNRNIAVRGGNAALFLYNEIKTGQDYYNGKITKEQFNTKSSMNVLSAISPEFGFIFLTYSTVEYIDNSWNEYMSHPNKAKKIYNKMNSSFDYWKKSMNGGF